MKLSKEQYDIFVYTTKQYEDIDIIGSGNKEVQPKKIDWKEIERIIEEVNK